MTRCMLGWFACSVVWLSGCASWDNNLTEKMPWSKSDSSKYDTPERLIAVWTDTVYQQPGKLPTRGFGGRVYFYSHDGEVVPVDGNLVVYAYDEGTTLEKPTRKYAFTAEQLTKYYGESDLGASYNIWIPWDKVGGDEKEISLFPVFADNSGKSVRGSFVKNRLPGVRKPTSEERRGFYTSRQDGSQPIQISPNVRQVTYQSDSQAPAIGSDETPRSGMKTTTIRVPRSMKERLASTPMGQVRQRQTDAAVELQRWKNSQQKSWTETLPGNSTLPSGDRASSNAVPTAPANYLPTPPPVGHHSGVQLQGPNATQQPAKLGEKGFIGADPQNSVSANSRAWARQDSRTARYEPPRFRAPVAPGAPSRHGHGRFQPALSTPPYSHPSPR